jgi:hypothetical protein
MAVAMLATPLTSTVLAKKITGQIWVITQSTLELGGANFVVRIPDEWNAMLVGWIKI